MPKGCDSVVERLSHPNPIKEFPVARAFSIYAGFGEPLKVLDDKQRKQLLQLRARGLPPRSKSWGPKCCNNADDPSWLLNGTAVDATPNSKRTHDEQSRRTNRRTNPAAAAVTEVLATTQVGAAEAARVAMAQARDMNLGVWRCGAPPVRLSDAAPEREGERQPPHVNVLVEALAKREAEIRRHQMRVMKRFEEAARSAARAADAKQAQAVRRVAEVKELNIAQARERLSAWVQRRKEARARVDEANDARNLAVSEAWRQKESKLEEWKQQIRLQESAAFESRIGDEELPPFY